MPWINGIYFTWEALNKLRDNDWNAMYCDEYTQNLEYDIMLNKACLYYELHNFS